jgi:hypothetical protein
LNKDFIMKYGEEEKKEFVEEEEFKTNEDMIE